MLAPRDSGHICEGDGVPGLVSVIIPLYNCERLIGAAIESVLAQTYQHMEIIVINDGSTDRSLAMAQQYAPRITVIDLPRNRGVAAARNCGMRVARGEYIAFLDADDLWSPRKLAVQLALLNAHPEVGLCVAAYYHGDHQARPHMLITPPATLSIEEIVRNCLILIGGVIVRRNVLQQSGGFDETLMAGEDWDLWIRVVALGTRYAPIRQPLWVYRRHGKNTSTSVPLMATYLLAVYDKYLMHPQLSPHLHSLIKRQIQRRQVAYIIQLFAGNHTMELAELVRNLHAQALSPEDVFEDLVTSIPYAGDICLDGGLNGHWDSHIGWLDLPRLHAMARTILPDVTRAQCRMLRTLGLLHCGVGARTLHNRRMAVLYALQALMTDAGTACGPGSRSFLLQSLLGNRVHGIMVAVRGVLSAARTANAQA